MKIKEQHKGLVSLIILAWVFATMGIFARFLSTEFDLFEQTYLRIGLALLMSLYFFRKKIQYKKLLLISKKDFFILILRSVSLYLGIVLITNAFLITTYSSATFTASLPLLPLFGYLILKEKIKLRTLAYILVGFVGFLFIGIKSFSDLSLGYGEISAFLALLMFDISYTTRKLQDDTLNDYEITAAMFLAGFLFLFITSLIMGEGLPSLSQFTPVVITVIFIASIFNLLNLFLTNYGFGKVKTAVAGNILTLEALFAFLYGVVLFKEPIVAKEVFGGILIIISVLLVNKSE